MRVGRDRFQRIDDSSNATLVGKVKTTESVSLRSFLVRSHRVQRNRKKFNQTVATLTKAATLLSTEGDKRKPCRVGHWEPITPFNISTLVGSEARCLRSPATISRGRSKASPDVDHELKKAIRTHGEIIWAFVGVRDRAIRLDLHPD